MEHCKQPHSLKKPYYRAEHDLRSFCQVLPHHRIITEWVGMDLKVPLAPTSCHRQGCRQLGQVAQDPTQPGLEYTTRYKTKHKHLALLVAL